MHLSSSPQGAIWMHPTFMMLPSHPCVGMMKAVFIGFCLNQSVTEAEVLKEVDSSSIHSAFANFLVKLKQMKQPHHHRQPRTALKPLS